MNEIKKEHILSAIKEIDIEGIRPGKTSSTYDLIYNGKPYPPKLVVSIANRHATGTELDHNNFSGGIGTPAFQLLEKKGFEITKKNESLSRLELKEAFLKEWPLYRIERMNLEEYTNLDKTSFCYWLEAKTDNLGGIGGGSAYKFGIYKRKDTSTIITVDNRITDDEYAWFQKYGTTKEIAYQSIKDTLIEIIKNAQSGTLENIDSIDLGDAYKWKIAFLYGNFNVVNIFKHEALLEAAQYLGFKESNKSYSHLNSYIIAQKKPKQDFFEFTDKLWATTSLASETKYWLYAPGENANKWEEFYEKGIIGLGWDQLGDLNNYKSKKEIKLKLQELEKVTSTKQNETAANYEFHKVIKEGDVIFVKKGIHELLGYGVVISDYYYDDDRDTYQKSRKMDWKVKGSWKVDFNLPVKTLTDVTKYPTEDPNYSRYYERLLAIMEINYKVKNYEKEFKEWLKIKIPTDSGTKGSYFKAIDLLNKKVDSNIFEIDNINKLKLLYKELLEVQKSKGNKYWDESTPSYGERGFYSSSIKAYIDFHTQLKEVNMNNKAYKAPLNQILYGPPGTGKTFELQNTYFNNFTIRETALTREQYLEGVIADLTWWQVISIAVYDLGSTKVSDIVNHEFIKIKEKLSSSKTVRPTIWGQLQSHTVMDCPYVNVSNRSEPLYFSKSEDSKWSIDEKLLEDYYPEGKNILAISKNYSPSNDILIKNYDFVTFHQSFSYEDFVEGIKPKLDEGETQVAFEIKDGIFKKLCIKAEADPSNNYAIFIDEINRGNVSAIFGELITLIEDDKRLNATNELKVKLPYSKREFGVPSNLYIIGTMNTADRSVEALDTALRRRFSFSEIMPKPELVANIEFQEFNLAEVLTTINERIEVLLDRDHAIGHSYFLKLNSGDTKGLKSIFKNNILPLLQEYFYHDYEKIALILGEGFIRINENKALQFASFKNIETPEISLQFEVISEIDNIETAVQLLLNRNV